MPPRYAYWTILIDQKPTAFRARDREELLPTFHQLQRRSSDVVMKWFARGKLWDTPEQAQWAQRNVERPHENRGRDWRPGGEHKDPRGGFKARPRVERSTKAGGLPGQSGPTIPRASGGGVPPAFKNRHVPGRRGPKAIKGSWAPPTFGATRPERPREPGARFRKPGKDRG